MGKSSLRKKMKARRQKAYRVAHNEHIRTCAICSGTITAINGQQPVCNWRYEVVKKTK